MRLFNITGALAPVASPLSSHSCYVADGADGCGSAPLKCSVDHVHHVATAATKTEQHGQVTTLFCTCTYSDSLGSNHFRRLPEGGACRGDSELDCGITLLDALAPEHRDAFLPAVRARPLQSELDDSCRRLRVLTAELRIGTSELSEPDCAQRLCELLLCRRTRTPEPTSEPGKRPSHASITVMPSLRG